MPDYSNEGKCNPPCPYWMGCGEFEENEGCMRQMEIKEKPLSYKDILLKQLILLKENVGSIKRDSSPYFIEEKQKQIMQMVEIIQRTILDIDKGGAR